MLNPWRLRLLVQLDSLGTIRAVADSLHISPSAVSQQLALLERETGATLLERKGRTVTVSTSGIALVEHAKTILGLMEVAESELLGLGSNPAGPVRIVGFASALRSIVLPSLSPLLDRYPDVEVSIFEAEAPQAIALLQRGECDLAILGDFETSRVTLPDDFHSHELMTDELKILFSRRHPPGVMDAPLQLAALAEVDWVVDSDSSPFSDAFAELCRRQGFSPRISGRYLSYTAMLQHVETGHAVTVLPELAISPVFEVDAVPLDPPVYRRILSVVRPSALQRRAVQVTLQHLSHQAEALTSDGQGAGQ